MLDMRKRIPLVLTLLFFSCFCHAQTELRIWTGRLQPQLKRIAERFYQDTGVRVKVESPANMTRQFEIVAAAGEGPDMLLWAHDMLGGWYQSGLIARVEPSPQLLGGANPLAWQAVSVDGNYTAWPLLLEAVSLVYNPALIDGPMRDFSQWPQIAKRLKADGKHALAWEYENPYYSWPLLASQGGNIFALEVGGVNPVQTGIDQPGAISAAMAIGNWVNQGLLPEGISYGDMMRMFVKGELAMMINGPWCWRDLKRNQVEFAVTLLPKLNGKPLKPFVGVYAVAVNSYSQQQMLAGLFIREYLMSPYGQQLLQSDGGSGFPVSNLLAEEARKDPHLQGLVASIYQGEPMPNLPQMRLFWPVMQTALSNIGSGRQSADEALQGAAERITKSDKGQ